MDYTLIVKLTNSCNLNCSYCYYRRNMNPNLHKVISRNNLDLMIRNLLSNNERYAHFIWHGGEPLLAGIDTFRFIVEKQKEYNYKNLKIINGVQTNGTLLNDEYIQFFEENHFSIGISFDGPFDIHSNGRGTTQSEYLHILSSIDKLCIPDAKWGVLCVVGKNHINNEQNLFDALRKYHIKNIGFLPCVVQNNGVLDQDATITPSEYGRFLVNFFDIWINSDIHRMSIRNYDDAIRHFKGYPAFTCIGKNHCNSYLTVTPDGGIYLCDNFSTNEVHHVGSIENGFSSIQLSAPMQWIIESMKDIPEGCRKCRYYDGCFGGCKYYRWISNHNMTQRQYYCQATRQLYDHIGAALAKGGTVTDASFLF